MAIDIAAEKKKQIVESIRRYFLEKMDEEIGELKAGLLLDFWMKEVAPTVYNIAVADVQSFMQERVADADGACYEPEFGYWQK